MKKSMLTLLTILHIGIASGHAITYEFSGGRFGDNLVAYCHARWVAYKYNIPFVYRPFTYSDQLNMHKIHASFSLADQTEFKTVIKLPEEGGLQESLQLTDPEALYVLPYFPECGHDIEKRNFFHFAINWHDEEFFNLIRHELSMQKPFPNLSLPRDRITVAVHVRTGGGFDKVCQMRSKLIGKSKFADKRVPLKFPPDSYYIEQIAALSSMLHDQPLYVHIFTDSATPKELVKKYKQAVNKPNIIYGCCREEGNSHDQNVLEDFFALTQFDCLIRSESNFSIMAAHISNYKIVISPTKYHWDLNKLVITDVAVEKAMPLKKVLA